MNTTNARAHRARIMQVLLLCLLGFLWLGAAPQARADSCSGANGNTYTIPLPSSVTVPRDAAVGTVLTGWTQDTGAYIGMWSCYISATTHGWGGYGMSALASAGMTTTYLGTTYTVFATGYPGIGMIMNVADGETNCGGFYNEGDIGLGWGGGICGGTMPVGSYPTGLHVSVALVKTAQPTAGMLSGMTVAQGVPATSASGATTRYSTYTVYYATTPVQVVVGACTTPDAIVPLGTFPKSAFTGIGYTTTAVAFSIKLNSCPAGMNSISYRIDPNTTVISASNSVVALDASSGATGVGVQLLKSAGTAAFPLSTNTTFGGYSSSTGGSYTISFKARYYQTSSSVTAGMANTSMTFTMTYL